MAYSLEINYNRTRKVTLRLTLAEYAQLQDRFQQTTCRALSAYLRRLVLEKPITIKVRDASLEALVEELILLKGELNAIGHNYNQAVKKLHTLRQLPEFRDWLRAQAALQEALLQKIAAINTCIAKIGDRWLHE
jgi:hypothetical protein